MLYRSLLFSVFLIVLFSKLLFAQQSTKQYQLKVSIENIQETRGMLRLALYPTAQGFPADIENAQLLINVKPVSGKVEVDLEAVPEGQYALAVLHDANGNGEMDTNLFGYPTEAYGFSNNVRPAFRAPVFEEASFWVNAENTELKIALQ